MLNDDTKNIYFKYHNGDELCYEKKINYLFRNTVSSIEKKLQSCFPIDTLNVINTKDKVAMVLYRKNVKKESIFSYIRPVDGVTRLKLCNCSNITGL